MEEEREKKIKKIWDYRNNRDFPLYQRVVLLFTICLMLYGYKNAYFTGYIPSDDTFTKVQKLIQELGLEKEIYTVDIKNPKNPETRLILVFNGRIDPKIAEYAVLGDYTPGSSKKLGEVLGMECSGDTMDRVKMIEEKNDSTYYGIGIDLLVKVKNLTKKFQIFSEVCMEINDRKKNMFMNRLMYKAHDFLEVALILDQNYKVQYYIEKMTEIKGVRTKEDILRETI